MMGEHDETCNHPDLKEVWWGSDPNLYAYCPDCGKFFDEHMKIVITKSEE